MGRDNRVHYLRKQSWATKSNKFRKIKTPGKTQFLNSFLKIIENMLSKTLKFRKKNYYPIHTKEM